MAWIESHQTLREHPKVLRLAAELQITRAQTIGHLHMLWWWCMDYAPNGDVSKFGPQELAIASDWRGDPVTLCNALVTNGWLEGSKLHDWESFSWRFQEMQTKKHFEREATRLRVRNWRKRNANVTVTDTPCNAPTVPNLTKPKQQHTTATKADGGFESFWTNYPNRKAKADALKAWGKVNPDSDLLGKILAGVESQKKSADWLKEGGKYIPYPATWLNGRRWEDEIKEASNVKGYTFI